MTQEALRMALDVLEVSTDWNVNATGKQLKSMQAITALRKALAQHDSVQAKPEPEQEPVAWRTFDGEGGYDYRSYESNESYADDWNKKNPNHVGWVDKLYTHAQREKNT